MDCLEKYRTNQIRETNRARRIVVRAPDESAVHDFRVGIKRLAALYHYLQAIDPALDAKKILRPYRKAFKSLGRVRDAQIAQQLISNEADDVAGRKPILAALRTQAQNDYRHFQQQVGVRTSIRTPSIRGCGVGERAILRGKRAVHDCLRQQILGYEPTLNADAWHRKRILLKRYHHQLDAFCFCPGHHTDDAEIKQIKLLEQLLGDWHDRVVTVELLRAIGNSESHPAAWVQMLQIQDRILLAAAGFYLQKFRDWQNSNCT